MVRTALIAVAALGVGCSLEQPPGETSQALLGDDLLDPADPETTDSDEPLPRHVRGEHLFNKAHFNGNGRRCSTCHPSGPGESGTLSPEDVQALFAANRNGPLFQWDAADTMGGDTFDRVLEDATILVELPLPEGVRLVGSDARSIVVPRSIPTTMNTPALDPVLMSDGRAASLQEQARGAIAGHAQSTNVSDDELEAIARFEVTLFNREPLREWANGGPPPELPPGNTESEKRGRVFFADPDSSMQSLCGHCHGGPNLDEVGTIGVVLGQVPPGTRFISAQVSEFNHEGNPLYTFEFRDPQLDQPIYVTTPDPGRALITGQAKDANAFKINTLWGISETAPYFHDNSAKTLEEVMEHYDRFFFEGSNGLVDLTEQDKADIVAYMKLL